MKEDESQNKNIVDYTKIYNGPSLPVLINDNQEVLVYFNQISVIYF